MAGSDKQKRKKQRSRARNKQLAADQDAALDFVRSWLAPRRSAPSPAAAGGDFLPSATRRAAADRNGDGTILFDLHSHSNHSDGFLSPAALVERAHRHGVKVLALTDHDTMSAVKEATMAAAKFGMRIIPAVEISAVHSSREKLVGEPVHILAYYSTCGPSNCEELEKLLATIRDGRFLRAKNILLKLNKLKVPINWEHVVRIAGEGVAPGRLHIAKAMVEAGYVADARQAFNKYLSDDGPAYAIGSEPPAEAVVQLISKTGGVSALAHPWSLKNPVTVINALKESGLHAVEVYRNDGKVAGFSELADMHGLVKLGGSDYHGKRREDESELGSVNLPIKSVCEFLKLSIPIWCNAAKDIVLSYAEEPSDANLIKLLKFGPPHKLEDCLSAKNPRQIIDLCLSEWLSDSGIEQTILDDVRLKLDSHKINC